MKTMKKVLAMLVSMVMVLAFCVTGGTRWGGLI